MMETMMRMVIGMVMMITEMMMRMVKLKHVGLDVAGHVSGEGKKKGTRR